VELAVQRIESGKKPDDEKSAAPAETPAAGP